MTHYFAFPASNALRDGSNTLQANFASRASEPQSALFVKVAQMFSDEIVDALLLNIVRGSSNSSNNKILESVASIIKSTVHTLIKNVLSKMSNDELRPLADVIHRRRLTMTRDGATTDFICFEMPADFHAQMREIMESGVKGNKHPQMLDAMMRFSDMSHAAFYDESVAPLKLGFIGRKMVDMGGSAIKAGSHSATKKLVPTLNGDDLVNFSAYYLGFLIEN